MKLFTIGYQAATQGEVIGRLKTAGVEVLVDVRAVAASRRPGFSKNLLAAGLADAGIDYVHLRALGTPAAGRTAARAGRTAEMRSIYTDYLDNEPAAQAELAEAADRRRGPRRCFAWRPMPASATAASSPSALSSATASRWWTFRRSVLLAPLAAEGADDFADDAGIAHGHDGGGERHAGRGDGFVAHQIHQFLGDAGRAFGASPPAARHGDEPDDEDDQGEDASDDGAAARVPT